MALQDVPEHIAEAIRNIVGVQQVGRTRVSLDFGSMVVNVALDLDITVTGALLGDFAHVGSETILESLLQRTANVVAADTVTVTLTNDAGGTIDPAANVTITHVLRSMET